MRDRLQAIWIAIISVIGIEEVAIYTALALIAAGCWFVWKPAAGLVPGVVMLWMYLPPRKPFIEQQPSTLPAIRRSGRES